MYIEVVESPGLPLKVSRQFPWSAEGYITGKPARRPAGSLVFAAIPRYPMGTSVFARESNGISVGTRGTPRVSMGSRWSQKRLSKKASRWKKTNRYEMFRAPQYQHAANGANGLCYTIPYRLQPNNTRNTPMTCTPKKRKRRKARRREKKTGRT